MRSILCRFICITALVVFTVLTAPLFPADDWHCMASAPTPSATPELPSPTMTDSPPASPARGNHTGGSPQATPPRASQPLPVDTAPNPEEQEQKNLVIPEKPGGRYVTVNGVNLFKLYAGTTIVPLERRVQFISQRLSEIVNDPNSAPEGFEAVYDESNGACQIYYSKKFIFRIGREDVPIQGMRTLSIGERYLDIIREAQQQAAAKIWKEREREGTRIGATGGVIFLIALILSILAIQWLSRRLTAMQGKHIRPLKIHNAVILSEEKITSAISSTVSVLNAVVFIITFAFFMDYLLAHFPGTIELRTALFANSLSYVRKASYSMLLYVPKLIFLVFFIIVVKILLGLCDTVFQAIDKGAIRVRSAYVPFVSVYHKIARFVIYFFGLILIVPNLPGYDMPAFKGLSILAGLMISLGSGTFIGSIFAGLSILISRTFKVGDRIMVGSYTGDVLEMSVNTTRLRTPAKQDIIIPNSYFLQNPVTNLSSPVEDNGSTIIFTEITIGYDVHGEIVADLCVKAGEATEGVLKEPKPFVLQKNLSDFYVTYMVGVHIDNPHQYLEITSTLCRNIRRFFDEAGVEIMSPHYTSLRDGNRVTIPGRYLPENYSAPSFNVTTGSEEKK
ncbi:MAG: mechanosensitive ion channel domain-containing protein [Vulcanimicrobiota bacterium]